MAMADGSAATAMRRMIPHVTTAGPDCHKIPSTGGTFLSACTRSRHALLEDFGLASVMEFRFERTLRRLDDCFLANVTNLMQFPLLLLAEGFSEPWRTPLAVHRGLC